MRNFRDAAARQRSKIKELKRDDLLKQNEEAYEEQGTKLKGSNKLTEQNLSKYEVQSQNENKKHKSKSNSKKHKKSSKPMWAMTEKDLEDKKEEEIDELLEFAYELDYEKYMEDFEVRQALAIIKDRVNEIKKDDDWKQKIVNEWN